MKQTNVNRTRHKTFVRLYFDTRGVIYEILLFKKHFIYVQKKQKYYLLETAI